MSIFTLRHSALHLWFSALRNAAIGGSRYGPNTPLACVRF
jgi:hypothetical protein